MRNVFKKNVGFLALILAISCSAPRVNTKLQHFDKNRRDLEMHGDDFLMHGEEFSHSYEYTSTMSMSESTIFMSEEEVEKKLKLIISNQEELKTSLKEDFNKDVLTSKMMKNVGQVLYPADYIIKPYKLLKSPQSIIGFGQYTMLVSTWGGGCFEVVDMTVFDKKHDEFGIDHYLDEISYTHKEGDSVYLYSYADFRFIPNSPVIGGELYIVRDKHGKNISITGFLRIEIERNKNDYIIVSFGERVKDNKNSSEKYISGVVIAKDTMKGKLEISFGKSSNIIKTSYNLESLTVNEKNLLKSLGLFNTTN